MHRRRKGAFAWQENREQGSAAVSCSPDVYTLGGVKMGLGLMGQLAVHGWCMALVHGVCGDVVGVWIIA